MVVGLPAQALILPVMDKCHDPDLVFFQKGFYITRLVHTHSYSHRNLINCLLSASTRPREKWPPEVPKQHYNRKSIFLKKP